LRFGGTQLETINPWFTTTCRDLCCAIHDQWNDFIRCIETGVIPDLEGIDQVKDNIQRFLQPNPDRAEELCKIGKATETPGWLRQIRPELHSLLLQNVQACCTRQHLFNVPLHPVQSHVIRHMRE
ncbi:hypothetical protein PISMIDRAFT_114049, partial [Pisolithus microcarpus 441]